VLVLSCPNKLEYSDKRGFINEFHVKELYRDELEALVAARLPEVAWYGQRPSFFSVIAPESALAPAAGNVAATGELVEIAETGASEATHALSHPLYFLVVAGRSAASVASLPPALSVLADRDDWVHRDYEKVMRMLEESAARGQALDATLADRERSISEMKDEVRVANASRCETEAKLVQRDSALHAREAELAVRNISLADKDLELQRRRSWRWWLKLPLIRLGILK
jgi:hypothetical protein